MGNRLVVVLRVKYLDDLMDAYSTRLSNVALAQPSGRTSINQVLIEDLEFTEDSGIYYLLEGFILEVVRRPAAVLVNVELLEKRAELDQMVPGWLRKL